MTELEKVREKITDIDKVIAKLFEKRMDCIKEVALIKKETGMPVLDKRREKALIDKNTILIENEEYRSYYVDFLKNTMDLSKSYQSRILKKHSAATSDLCDDGAAMTLTVELGKSSYDIVIGKGVLSKVGEHFNLKRKVLILTDTGVPKEYSERVKAASKQPYVITIPMGEGSKSIKSYTHVLTKMLEYGFTRTDCVVAVGGGVVGDLAGFVAASYMRGIDFYNLPTTLLSQIDSSIGGKVAIDLIEYKNAVGAFYQPKKVLIDPNVLKTLDKRQLKNGMAEAIKMAACFDEELFSVFENGSPENELERIIEKSLKIKKGVVERDERETSLRRVLNFGHTVGHGIEKTLGLCDIYHGEAVGIGMLYTSEGTARERILRALKNVGLPTNIAFDIEKVCKAISRDKKADGDMINLVMVDKIGSYRFEKVDISEFSKRIKTLKI